MLSRANDGWHERSSSPRTVQNKKKELTGRRELALLYYSYHTCLGCDFFERRGEKRIDIRRFLGYVCQIAKVRVRMSSDGSLFSPKRVEYAT